MIATLKGNVSHCSLNSAVVEIGGFGVLVHLTVPFASSLKVGQKVEIATHLVVREDALTLYGFENIEGKEVFELLQRVSGIGPKVALSALSLYEPGKILSLISMGDLDLLEKIPGVGKKGVARVVLELKDKVAMLPQSHSSVSHLENSLHREEIKSALLNLGYNNKDADKAIEEFWSSGTNFEELSLTQMLKSILQMLGTSKK
jgi:Holliday junction DNA helicase RuvA